MDGLSPDPFGRLADAQLLHSTTLGARWGGFNDTEYGIGSLTYAVGGGPCELWEQLPLTDVGTNTSSAFAMRVGPGGACVPVPVGSAAAGPGSEACSIVENTTICFVVRADNHHGHSATGDTRASSAQTLICCSCPCTSPAPTYP